MLLKIGIYTDRPRGLAKPDAANSSRRWSHIGPLKKGTYLVLGFFGRESIFSPGGLIYRYFLPPGVSGRYIIAAQRP